MTTRDAHDAHGLPAPATLLAAHDAARLVDPAVRGTGGAGRFEAAIAVQAGVVALRRARGELPVGYKIGFTHRGIWPAYGVDRPIWGPVYTTTLTMLPDARAEVDAGRWIQPRLEPEIVLGLGASPPAAAAEDPARLCESIAWVAHGFEIVTSVYPGWQFDAAEAHAAQAMHAALLVGPRVPLAALGRDPVAALASLRVRLECDGRPVADGVGSNALDGPVQALARLLAELARRGGGLEAGQLITTGTLTDAQPLVPGQRWRTRIEGAPLAGLALEVTGR